MAGCFLLSACVGTPASESPSGLPSASVEATATTVASATPEPTPSPTEELLEASAYGSRATVVVDRLRVRYFPNLESDITDRLDRGTEVRIMEGPVTADGFRWYSISYGSSIDERYPGAEQAGWVAEVQVGSSGGETTFDPFIEIAEPVCPGSIDTELLAGLSMYAMAVCDVQVETVDGLIDWCFEGPISPFTYEPGWVHFSCPYIRSEESGEGGWFLNLAFPPDVELPERGDVVTLQGQVGFDEGQYGDCTVETIGSESEPSLMEALEYQRQLWDQQCQLRFVVSDVVVEDHIDLPPI